MNGKFPVKVVDEIPEDSVSKLFKLDLDKIKLTLHDSRTCEICIREAKKRKPEVFDGIFKKITW